MDPKLLAVVNPSLPKFNETIASGFHQRDFERVEKVYDQNLRMTFEGLDKKGVWYLGLTRVNPSEMFDLISGNAKNKTSKTFETSKESLYPVCLNIGFGPTRESATPFPPTFILLPYCDEYGDMFLRNSQYSLQFVLAERGLSVTKDDQIFVRILGYKFKVGAENYEFVQIHHEVSTQPTSIIPTNLPCNRFYQSSESRRPTSRFTPQPLLAWYVFAEYGFTETMRKFGECEFLVGDRDAIIEECPAKDGWQIFSTKGVPSTRYVTQYTDTGYAIGVRSTNPKRKGVISTVALQYVSALLFMFDTFSAVISLNKLDDRYYWRLIIGYTSVRLGEYKEQGKIFNLLQNTDNVKGLLNAMQQGRVPEIKSLIALSKQMNDHFDSISDLDESSISKFAEQRISVKNMFELFNYIVANRTEIVRTSDKANMLHKELSSLEFTIDKLVTAAHRFKYDVKNTTDLNFDKVKKFITMHFRLREIDSAARSSNMILESTPTDCPLADYGLGAMSQTKVFNSQNNGRSAEFNVNDPANGLHASLFFVMSWQRVTKPSPDARGYLLPCLHLTNGRYTSLAPEDVEEYERIQHRLTKREVTIK